MTLRIEDMIREKGHAERAAKRAMDEQYGTLGNKRLRELADLLESADRNDYEDYGDEVVEGTGGYRPHLRSVERVLAARKVRR